MRVLILSALAALAAAAPSNLVAPVAPVAPVVAPLLYSPVTVAPGDIEAAQVNAKTYAEDQAQFAADQAQLAADQAQLASDQARMFTDENVEQHNEKSVKMDSAMKEHSGEAMWAMEDKKWQAVDAVKTAEAQVDGAIASNAQMIARSAFGNLYVPGYIPAPLMYSAPAIFSQPGLKAMEQPAQHAMPAEPAMSAQPEAPKEEKPEEPIMKTSEDKPAMAEPTKEAEKPSEKPQFLPAPLPFPAFKFASPWMTPVAPYPAPLAYYQPGLPSFYQAPYVAPFLKQW